MIRKIFGGTLIGSWFIVMLVVSLILFIAACSTIVYNFLNNGIWAGFISIPFSFIVASIIYGIIFLLTYGLSYGLMALGSLLWGNKGD